MRSLGRFIQLLMPEGANRFLDYQRRFLTLGMPRNWATYSSRRAALQLSHVELLPQLPSELPYVIDVGANVGDWSVSLMSLVRVNRLVAYEPLPTIFPILAERISHFPQAACIQAAIGATNGTIVMNSEALSPVSSIRQLTQAGRTYHGLVKTAPTTVEVPMITLDDSISDQESPFLLKLDAQGYENEILLGAQRLLRRTQILLTEIMYMPYYEGALAFGDLYELITALGPFRIWSVSAPHLSERGVPLWADAVFVNSELWHE